MNGKGSVDAIEHALFDHVLGTVKALFPWLEHEANLAGEFALVLAEQSGCTCQHGDVGVMATSVHRTIDLGLERRFVVLLERQGIHVAPQQHGRPRLASIEIGDHGCRRLSERDAEPKPCQRVEDPLLSSRELETQLRIGMDASAQFDRLTIEGGGSSEDVRSESICHGPIVGTCTEVGIPEGAIPNLDATPPRSKNTRGRHMTGRTLAWDY